MTSDAIEPPINSREFFSYLLISSGALLVFLFFGLLYFWLWPIMITDPWVSLGPADQFPQYIHGETNPVKIDDNEFIVWVIHLNDDYLVLDAQTTHALGGPGLRGCFYAWNIVSLRFVDPCYGSKFRVDGVVIDSPSQHDLIRYDTRIDEAGILYFRITGNEPLVCRDMNTRRGAWSQLTDPALEELPPLCTS